MRVVDPIDWAVTASDCLNGKCDPLDVTFALLPFINGGMDDAVDAIRTTTNVGEEAVQTASRWSRWNFRKNLQRLTGKGLDDIVGLEAHHVLPQEFEKQFLDAGLDIHDPAFGSWVDATAHRAWSNAYNQRWKEFLQKPRTKEEILNFAQDLAKDFKFDVNFNSY